MTPRMSVLVPHHHDEISLGLLMSSLEKQETSFPYEIIVISNPPSKKAEELLRKNSRIIHLQTEQVGVNKARNLGVRQAQGSILLFLDSDCEVRVCNFLQRHFNLHQDFPRVSCIGGTYSYDGSDICNLTYNFIQVRWLLSGQRENFCRYLIGGNFSCKKEDLGGVEFDENIVYGGSETEFFIRLRKERNKAFKLFPDLVVTHNAKMGIKEFIRKAYKQGSGGFYILNKMGEGLDHFSSSSDLLRHHKLFYRKKMDYWLALYDCAYNKGFYGHKDFSNTAAAAIYFETSLKYYFTRFSNFFGSLENLLRNLPKK